MATYSALLKIWEKNFMHMQKLIVCLNIGMRKWIVLKPDRASEKNRSPVAWRCYYVTRNNHYRENPPRLKRKPTLLEYHNMLKTIWLWTYTAPGKGRAEKAKLGWERIQSHAESTQISGSSPPFSLELCLSGGSVIMDMLIGMIGDADHGSTLPQCYTQLPRANIRLD